jgi:hypothetical protein
VVHGVIVSGGLLLLALGTLPHVEAKQPKLLVSMDFVSQEHGVPRDGPKDSNAGG